MATRNRYLVLLAVLSTLALAGCTSQTNSGDSGDTSGSGGGSDTNSGDLTCASYTESTDPNLELFTTTAVASGPSEGQVYGDGTEFSVTLSSEAMDAGLLPQFELYTLGDAGTAVLISSLAFDPTTGGDGTFSTSTLEFGNDEYVGDAVVAQIFAISDATVGDAKQSGDKLLLGNYCISYANDGS